MPPLGNFDAIPAVSHSRESSASRLPQVQSASSGSGHSSHAATPAPPMRSLPATPTQPSRSHSHAQASPQPRAPMAPTTPLSPTFAATPSPRQARTAVRQRSRSFDAGFVAQLHSFHLATQAQAAAAEQAARQSKAMPWANWAGAHAITSPSAKLAPSQVQLSNALAASAINQPGSASARHARERQLRVAYLNPSGTNATAAAAMATGSAPASAASSQQSGSDRTQSPSRSHHRSLVSPTPPTSAPPSFSSTMPLPLPNTHVPSLFNSTGFIRPPFSMTTALPGGGSLPLAPLSMPYAPFMYPPLPPPGSAGGLGSPLVSPLVSPRTLSFGTTTPLPPSLALPLNPWGAGLLPGSMGVSNGGGHFYGYINTNRLSPFPPGVAAPPVPPASTGTAPSAAATPASGAATASNGTPNAATPNAATPGAGTPTTATPSATTPSSPAMDGRELSVPSSPPGSSRQSIKNAAGRKSKTSSAMDLHSSGGAASSDVSSAALSSLALPPSSPQPISSTKGSAEARLAAAAARLQANGGGPIRRPRKERQEREEREAREAAAAAAAAAEALAARIREQAALKEKEKDKDIARMHAREAAALSRVAESDAERTRARKAEQAAQEKERALAAKQREAMAEAALARAKQAETSKARQDLVAELERTAKEKERKAEQAALNRLRSQLPLPTFFSPTLAYALKVESSHNKGDARSPRKADIGRIGTKGGALSRSTTANSNSSNNAAAAGGSEESKSNTSSASSIVASSPKGGSSAPVGALLSRARKPSVYDGADWDALRSLSRAVAAAQSSSALDEEGEEGDDGEGVDDDEIFSPDDEPTTSTPSSPPGHARRPSAALLKAAATKLKPVSVPGAGGRGGPRASIIVPRTDTGSGAGASGESFAKLVANAIDAAQLAASKAAGPGGVAASAGGAARPSTTGVIVPKPPSADQLQLAANKLKPVIQPGAARKPSAPKSPVQSRPSSPPRVDSSAPGVDGAATTAAAAPTPATPGGGGGGGRHARSLSDIAREHIASQLTKISSKHTGAAVKVQKIRRAKKAVLSKNHTEKQRRIDEIRAARTAELQRMARELTELELAGALSPGQKVESQLVLAMKLSKAAKAGDIDEIKALAADKNETDNNVKAWVNRHDSAGSTAIFHATWIGHLAALELLFSLGAEVNHQNNRKNTALHLACDRGHHAVIKLLLERGANPLLKNHEGVAPYGMTSAAAGRSAAADSLEMALYIRQCLEDCIVERSALGHKHVGGIGLGMAAVHLEKQSEGEAGASAAAAAATAGDEEQKEEGAAAAPEPSDVPTAPTLSATADFSPFSSPRSAAATAALSAAPSQNTSGVSATLPLLQEYLTGINEYITARIALSQSIRRVKMKIWTAVRVKLRLGVFSAIRRQAEQQEAAEAAAAEGTEGAAAAPSADLPVISIPLPATTGEEAATEAAEETAEAQTEPAPEPEPEPAA